MTDVLVILGPLASGSSSDALRPSELSGVGFGLEAAAMAGGQADGLVLGDVSDGVLAGLATTGLRTVYRVEHPDLIAYTAEAASRAVEIVAESRAYRLICAPTSSSSREFLPRLAARRGIPMASDVTAIDSLDAERGKFTRAVFVGNVVASWEVTGPEAAVTCRASAFGPASVGATDETAPIERVELPDALRHARKRRVDTRRVVSERPDLGDAAIVVSAGRGTKGPDSGVLLCEELADVLGAAVGASRAVVDAGWLPNELQVGQTGRVVAPSLYIAVGISGAIQHLAGMRGARTVVAINKDPDAPIFDVADYAWVADLFDALPELIEELRE